MASAILMELQYLPPIQYFTKFIQYDTIWIEQQENYKKGSYRNRCHIASANGLLRLSIPLEKGKNEQQNIREVKIAYHEPWSNQHWTAIRSAYGNAPFFEFYADEIAPLFQQKYDTLFQLNWAFLEIILELIQLPATIKRTETFQETPPDPIFDFRNGIFPKIHRQKEDLNFKPIAYPQVFQEKHGFLPNLSILDLLFCTGPQASIILEQSVNF